MTQPTTVTAYQPWIDAMLGTLDSNRQLIDATIAQLTDAELNARPSENTNSIAVILRHLGGNLRSRWTDFLVTDGEKPDRDRDSEFQDWKGDRASLIAHLDDGWKTLQQALRQIDASNIDQPVFVRGERNTIPQAVTRSVTHLTYHTGQIVMIARMVHQGEWRWLTIPPGESAQFNARTWGQTPHHGGADAGSRL